MEKKLILISRGQSFLVSNIRDKLKNDGWTIYDADADVQSISQVRKSADIIVFYMPDEIEKADVMSFVRDSVEEDGKTLYLIGAPEELKETYKTIPQSVVRRSFERPLNVTDFIFVLDKDADTDGRKNILVVDDDPVFLRSVKTWLSKKYQVTMVSSGMNAITYLGGHTPDLILLDYEMPVTDGPQVLKMIRSENTTKNTPVIFLTGKNDRQSVMNVLDLKPDGYLLKTMTSDEVLQAVDDFFHKKALGK